MRPLGSGDSSFPKTPTLLQVIKEGTPIPDVSLVKLLFKPGKINVFSFITEAGYRVNCREDGPLFRDLVVMYDEIYQQDMALFIQVTDKEKGHWMLTTDDDSSTVWEMRDWGLTMSAHEKKPKKRAAKNQRAVE